MEKVGAAGVITVEEAKSMETSLEDIAALTGARVISEELGMKLENAKLSDLGSAKKVRVNKDKTILIEGQGKKEDIKQRLESSIL